MNQISPKYFLVSVNPMNPQSGFIVPSFEPQHIIMLFPWCTQFQYSGTNMILPLLTPLKPVFQTYTATPASPCATVYQTTEQADTETSCT